MAKRITDGEKERIINLRLNGYKYKDIANIIKEEFNKDSVSLGTIFNVLNEENDSYIDEETSKAIDDMILEKTKKSWTRNYIRKVNRSLEFTSSVEEIASLFDSVLGKWEFPTLLQKDYPYYTADGTNKKAYIFVGDLHFGRSTEELRVNWEKMIFELGNLDYTHYTFFLMGDLIESPRVTGMHDAQVLEMDYLGINQALGCVDMIASGIETLIKWGYRISIVGMNGNHARMSKQRDGDPERIVGCFMYEMLKKIFPDTDIRYTKDGVITEDSDRLHFILSHGDGGFNSKSDINIMQALGQLGKLNIIASGHWHSSQLTQGNGYIRLQIPSLNQQSEYEKNKFIAKGQPGYVILSEGISSPEISFKFLSKQS